MLAKPNPLLESEFSVSTGPTNRKSLWLTCKNCNAYSAAKNNSRALDHLLECEPYKAKKEALASVDDSASRKRQRTLTVSSMLVSRKRKLDSMAVMAIYIGADHFDYRRIDI